MFLIFTFSASSFSALKPLISDQEEHPPDSPVSGDFSRDRLVLSVNPGEPGISASDKK